MKSSASSLQYIKWTQAVCGHGAETTPANTGHKILASSARLPAARLGGVASAGPIAYCHSAIQGALVWDHRHLPRVELTWLCCKVCTNQWGLAGGEPGLEAR